MEEKSSAGAGVLGIFPEPYAPPGGTGLTARCHLMTMESLWLQESLGYGIVEKYGFVLSLGFGSGSLMITWIMRITI